MITKEEMERGDVYKKNFSAIKEFEEEWKYPFEVEKKKQDGKTPVKATKAAVQRKRKRADGV